jgi:hypothetical protein
MRVCRSNLEILNKRIYNNCLKAIWEAVLVVVAEDTDEIRIISLCHPSEQEREVCCDWLEND